MDGAVRAGGGGGIVTHTPGPWKFYDAWGSKQVMFASLGNEDNTVLEAARCGVDCVLSNGDDAYLIAACPTMYDYIAKKAAEGDEDAAKIIAAI